MEARKHAQKAAARSAPRGWSASSLLSLLGGILLFGAAAYAAQTTLHAWLLAQDRYLVVKATAPLALREVGPIAEQTSLSQPDMVAPMAAEDPLAVGATNGSGATSPVTGSGAEPVQNTTAIPAPPEASTVPEPEEVRAPPPEASTVPGPEEVRAPQLPAQPTPASGTAVRIHIPAIGINRGIIELPLTYNSRTGSWERDYDLLFRRAGNDLVGHWEGSATPGQPGNMILVGHNYGYGYKAVFVHLGRLKAGQRVQVVNDRGQVYTYRVTEVKRIDWRKKNEQELLQHLPYLSVEGPERLTLVTCGGSTWAPYPERVYVVAEPER